MMMIFYFNDVVVRLYYGPATLQVLAVRQLAAPEINPGRFGRRSA
jgi:hypothetical protein